MSAPARAGAAPDAVWIPGPDPVDLAAELRAGPVPESFWRALRWFSGGRIAVAVMLAALAYVSRTTPVFSFDDLSLFGPLAFGYLVLAVMLFALTRTLRPLFYTQLVTQVVLDLAVFIALIWAAGGVRSGLGVLMVATVASAATVSPPRLAAAFAAAATLLLLGETALRIQDDAGFDPAALANAALLGTVCFLTGIAVSWLAARLHMQEELARRRGEELRSQLAVTHQVMAELDRGVVVIGADGEVRAINRAAQTMLGVDPAAWWAGRPLRFEHIASGAWQGLAEAFRQARAGRGVNAVSEFAVVADAAGTAPGTHRIGLRLLGEGDATQGDTVLLLEDLRVVEERAQQLKLASMGRLSASIAHEIRNPLGAIRHANGLLGESLGLAAHKRLVRIVEDNTLRINRIIEDVLSISRRDRAMEEPIEMLDFLRRVLAEYASETESIADRVVVSVTSRQPLLFDENHLRQVLANLLGNALRYASKERAAIVIEWREGSAGEPELRFCDDGPGISEAALAHVFEPFFTTESRGTGLGLYLARELCRANHATIRYEPVGRESRYRGVFVVTRPQHGNGQEASG